MTRASASRPARTKARSVRASALGLLIAAIGMGCYVAPVMPPAGIFYASIEAPQSLSINGQHVGSRRGEASCSSVLMLVAWGDCSAHAAAEDGGISALQHLDYSYTNVLLFYQRLTTVAYGD